MSYAVKFTPDGGRIDVKVEQGSSHVMICVRAKGRGIHSDQLSVIFDMFQKGAGDGTTRHRAGGVQGLTEMHGGSVEARSDGDGHGSEFVVRLPIAAEMPAT